MQSRCFLCGVFIAGLTLLTSVAVGQTLDEARKAVRKPKPSKSSSTRRRAVDPDQPSITAGFGIAGSKKKHHPFASLSVGSDDDEPLDNLAGRIFLAAASSPFVVPRAMLGDDGKKGFYPDYPYHNASCGIVFKEESPGVHNSLIVLQTMYGTDFDQLDHANGRLFADMDVRLGIDTEFFYRREDLPAGNDELWHGDFNMTWRFAQNEHWQLRAGLGVNWLADRFDTNAGLNTTYGFEWFPRDPIVVSSLIDWGRVGSSSVFHFRSTVSVQPKTAGESSRVSITSRSAMRKCHNG